MIRKTKIVCTLGPSSDTDEMVGKLMDAGMNVCRLNMSHGSYEEQGERITPTRPIVNGELSYCPGCGERTPRGAAHSFCPECGQALDWSLEPTEDAFEKGLEELRKICNGEEAEK